MLLKMLVSMAGPEFTLSPGDEHEFENEEAGRLIEAGFAEEAEAEETEKPARGRKKVS